MTDKMISQPNKPGLKQSPDPILTEDLDDLLTPGVMVEMDQEEADALGAFEETALTEADAWEANNDLEDEANNG